MARDLPISQTRNIGIMAHIDAGKTTTTERVLFYTGVNRRIGEVHEGTATMDWMDEEHKRGISIVSAATTCYHRNHRVNIIDTPGHVDFTVEVERCLRVLDGAVAIFDGVAGVQSQSETVWRQANRYNVPRVAFVNKLDKVGADFDRVVDAIRTRLRGNPIAIQLPYFENEKFVGVIDLIKHELVVWHDEDHGRKFDLRAIPDSDREHVAAARAHLIEAVSEVDDVLMALFLDGKTIEPPAILGALRRATIAMKAVPVLCGSAFRNKGVQPLLDAVVDFLPSPLDIPPVRGVQPETRKPQTRRADDAEPFAALAFKIMHDPQVGPLTFFRVYSGVIEAGSTVYNAARGKRERIGKLLRMHANLREEVKEVVAGNIGAAVGLRITTTGDTLCDENAPLVLEQMRFATPVISLAVEVKTAAEEPTLGQALERLAAEDPTLRVQKDAQTGQTIIAGMGELHLEIIVDRLRREFAVDVNVGKPMVDYRETISGNADENYRHDKQIGRYGQFAHVHIALEPHARGKGVVLQNDVPPGTLTKEYLAAVEKGLRNACERGVLAGYPLVDLKVRLLDAGWSPVDSSVAAFELAAAFALGEAARRARPILLEPLMKLEVITPDEFTGVVIGDLAARRGRIVNVEGHGGMPMIHAEVPLATMFGYLTDLRSASQGRATFSMDFSHYAPLPQAIADSVITRL